MKNTKIIMIITIIVIAAFLRLYKLGSYPALNADEAAIGYNAYSLLETGKDEHGNPWPIHFQSFNDYKPGLYVYLIMPFVAVLGLNEWSVRLPNALFGIGTVYVLYLLIKQILENRSGNTQINTRINAESSSRLPTTNHQSLPYLAAFFLAVSPWHLHFSRGGWEVNTATFCILLGVYFFLSYLRNRKILSFEFCVLSFALSMYSYHSARIISPLLMIGMLTIFWKDLRLKIKQLLVLGLIGFLFITPLIIDLTKSNIVSRAAGVGLFADTGPIERTNEQRTEHLGFTSRLFHNKLTNYGITFLKNWGEHYHGLFLFVSGDVIQRNAVPETGQMHLFEIITVAVGLFVLFSPIIRNSKFIILILFWLLIAPIPAALTFQSPHALRSQNMVIPLTILSAIGLTYIIEKINSLCHSERNRVKAIETKESHYKTTNIQYTIYNILRFSCYLLLVTVILWSFSRYLHMYFIHMSKEYPYSSQYGVKELVKYIETKTNSPVVLVSEQSERIQNPYKNIVVTNKYDQPYILFLFYLKYPPQEFQKEHTLTPRDSYGFSTVESFGNYIFKSIVWDGDKLLYRDSLIIGSNEEIPDETNITKRIYGINDFLYFKVVEN